MDVQHPRRRRSGVMRSVAMAALVTVVATGCSAEAQRGWLPGYDDGQQVTNHTERVTSLWVGSWIAALVVGVIVWGLILWCVTVYRKRKDDDVLPIQLRYHVPLEVMYTVLPILMVGVFFYYTARDMDVLEDTSAEPDVTIEVYGKQWSWDFNYLDEDVYDTGVHVEDIGGVTGNPETLPTLYLPVDQTVEFHLRSRDVIHSFWVPAFLYKKDMFPSSERIFQVVPTREGVYAGKCAEFCGEHHSGMLFNVAVVSQEEYDAHIDALRAEGQTGRLGPELDRSLNPGGDSRGPGGGAVTDRGGEDG